MSDPAPSATSYVRSAHLSRFVHGEYHYLYHDATGYILQMSEDVLAFLDRFVAPLSEAAATEACRGTYDADEVRRFVNVFEQYGCLVRAGADEHEGLWRMFPVRAKWGVHRRDERGDVHVYWREGARVASRRLVGWQAALWQAMDGDTQLSAVYARVRAGIDRPEAAFRAEFLDLVGFLTHSARQLLKLSEYPLGFYKGARSTPPYLLSHLPYRRADEPTPPDLDPQLERISRSLFTLLALPNALLEGRPYGACLLDALIERRVLPEPPRRVLDLSMDMGAALATLVPRLEADAEVHVLARDERDEARYREALGPHSECLRFVRGTPERLPDLRKLGTFDLVLAQEALGAMEHMTVDKGKPKGEAARLDKAYDLFAGEAGDHFLVNVGGLKLVEALPGLLAGGGKAVIVDYGDEFQRPVTSTTAEQPYFLVHFGELKAVARHLGMSVFFGFLIDLLPFQRERFALSTSRSHLACLTQALADAGVTIDPAYPYTAEELGPLTKDVEVGNVFFEKAEDRCLGVVPHQVKVLVLGVPDALEL